MVPVMLKRSLNRPILLDSFSSWTVSNLVSEMKFPRLFNIGNIRRSFISSISSCLYRMLTEVIESNDTTLELKLRDEDISVMLIIQHELLNKKDIDFAGVILKHPLIRDYIMRIVTKKEDPAEALKEASTNASKYLEELGSTIKTQLRN